MEDRSMRILCSLGDVEIVWDADRDDEMRELIQRKMDRGIRFFVVEPVLFGLAKKGKRIKSASDIGRNIRIHDRDVVEMLEAGKAAVFRRTDGLVLPGTRLAESAAEAVKRHTVAVPILTGG